MILFLSFLAQVHCELFAVIELAREPTTNPRFSLPIIETHKENLGDISEKGIQQELSLGQFINQRYGNIILETFNENATYFVKNRKSAIAALNYQIQGIFSNKLKLKPKPKDYTKDELMLSPEIHCQRLVSLLKSNFLIFESHPLYTNLTQYSYELEPLIGNISVLQVYFLGDFILSYTEQGLILPFILSKECQKLVIEIYHKYHEWLLYGSIEQGKLGFTDLALSITDYLKRLLRPIKSQRFLPIMMDEGQFLAFLHFLGLDFTPKPPAAAIFIEIHKYSDRTTFRIFYENQYVESDTFGLEHNVDFLIDFFNSRVFVGGAKRICNIVKGSIKESMTWRYWTAGAIGVLLFIMAAYWRRIEPWIIGKKIEEAKKE
ncbi:hypothetical protein SteCoe_11002 [Stentor coeruleus]|uniref:Uncharacterized protein n=1 Tax=Stentor coeruleus TaxID=5963 RepID=A0A1R2CED8_9CILI|nr:hypothetical protein SteCoe_11002 [Stentor coeruleus]